jgi:putative membrane protein
MPVLLAAVPSALLQAVPPALPMQPAPLWRLMLDAALFGLSGIVLLIIGYYLWELITPYNLRREIHENKNTAVAIVVAAFILGMAIIIAASLILIK